MLNLVSRRTALSIEHWPTSPVIDARSRVVHRSAQRWNLASSPV